MSIRVGTRTPGAFVQVDLAACRAWAGHEGPCVAVVQEADVRAVLHAMAD